MKITICCALEQEARPLRKRLRLKPVQDSGRVWSGIHKSHALRLVITGPGRENVHTAFQEIFQAPLPEMIVSYGFAGALSPDLKRGDILIANQVMLNNHQNSVFQITGKNFSFERQAFTLHEGPLLSTLDIVGISEEKVFLGRRYNALAVDTESGYLCAETMRRKLRFFAIRGITDTARESIPRVMQNWTDPDGKLMKQKVIQDVLENPKMIPSLVRLGFASFKAGRHLMQGLTRFLETIQ